jgi:tRNA (guanine37-N1)-methyltransferase
MKILDKSIFSSICVVLALRIPPRLVQKALDLFSKTNLLLNVPRVKNVVNDFQIGNKLVLFNSNIKTVHELSQEARNFIEEHHLDVCQHSLRLDYDHLSADQVLRTLLPTTVTIPTAFETIGHIAHVNLRDEHEAYKYLIGEVLLDKHGPQIKTVVNKIHTIESVYRCFPMEILAGDPNLITKVNENSCIFELDFGKVYWNSRLHTEHERLVNKFFKEGEIIVDMFAGVGPFVIPAAKLKGCRVYANDLNPDSYLYLRENMKLNHIDSDLMKIYNLDARYFLMRLVKEEGIRHIDHIIMNLPAISIEFLDVVPHIYEFLIEPLPLLHCYHFVQNSRTPSSNEDHLSISIEKIRQFIPPLSNNDCICYHRVRDVSPTKEMNCLSFRLPTLIESDLRKKRTKLE